MKREPLPQYMWGGAKWLDCCVHFFPFWTCYSFIRYSAADSESCIADNQICLSCFSRYSAQKNTHCLAYIYMCLLKPGSPWGLIMAPQWPFQARPLHPVAHLHGIATETWETAWSELDHWSIWLSIVLSALTGSSPPQFWTSYLHPTQNCQGIFFLLYLVMLGVEPETLRSTCATTELLPGPKKGGCMVQWCT